MTSLNLNTISSRRSFVGSKVYARKNNKTVQPTMRGAFPKPVKYSLDEDGLTNARENYNKNLRMQKSAYTSLNTSKGRLGYSSVSARRSREYFTGKSFSSNSNSRSVVSSYDGNAAVEVYEKPKRNKLPKYNLKLKSGLTVLKGGMHKKNVFATSHFSPIFVTVTKYIVAVIFVIAVVAFLRVGVTSATVATGLETQTTTNNIETELATKNILEVQDSTLSNTGRIRSEANRYNLVSPTSVEQIVIAPDVVAYDSKGNVSLVESLNRVAHSTN